MQLLLLLQEDGVVFRDNRFLQVQLDVEAFLCNLVSAGSDFCIKHRHASQLLNLLREVVLFVFKKPLFLRRPYTVENSLATVLLGVVFGRNFFVCTLEYFELIGDIERLDHLPNSFLDSALNKQHTVLRLQAFYLFGGIVDDLVYACMD